MRTARCPVYPATKLDAGQDISTDENFKEIVQWVPPQRIDKIVLK